MKDTNLPTKMYLDGELVDADGGIEIINPATDCIVANVAADGLDDVDRALAAARNAQPGLSCTSIADRQHWMGLPHGGIGRAGIGHDCSRLALQDCLIVKRVSRALV